MASTPRICISSPPDREKLVAEIFFGEIQWAELNKEHDVVEVEFYPRPDGKPWLLSLESAVQVLAEARKRLIDELQAPQE